MLDPAIEYTAPMSQLFLTRLFALILVLPAMSFTTPGDSADAAIRQLRKAILRQRDGSHLPRLASLRQLGDPTLRPIFEHLARSPEWQVQVHAILGMAEITVPKRIAPDRLLQLGPLPQETIIANAIDMQLIANEQYAILLGDGRLGEMSRLLILAELMLLNEPVALDLLRQSATSTDLRISALGSSLLARHGDPSALRAFANQLTGLASEIRNQNLILILEMLRQYKARAATNWIIELITQEDVHTEVAYRGTLSLLELDSRAGLMIWNDLLGTEPTHRQLVRFGLLLLASKADIPASTYDKLQSDEELIKAMVQLGKATARKENQSEAFIDLLELEHRKSTAWAILALEELEPEQSSVVYLHLIDRLNDDTRERPQRIALAIRAVSSLMEIKPQLVLDRLARAKDNGIMQQALLLGLLGTDNPAAGQAAAALTRIGFDRADSLALILMAKHIQILETKDRDVLGMIASGGGRVSESLQTQAAWLFLRHTGAIQSSLPRLLN